MSQNARREELKALSAGARILVQQGAFDSINDVLVDIYRQQGHTTLKTFNEWRKEGKHVKKGEKALLLWGKPRAIKGKEAPANPPAEGEEEEENFFPVAYVFSNLQTVSNE